MAQGATTSLSWMRLHSGRTAATVSSPSPPASRRDNKVATPYFFGLGGASLRNLTCQMNLPPFNMAFAHGETLEMQESRGGRSCCWLW